MKISMRILTLFVALLFTFHVCTVPAQATGVETVTLLPALGPAGIIILATLAALGIGMAVTGTDFHDLADMIEAAARNAGLVDVNGNITLLKDMTTGKTYASAELLDFTRDYLWENGILSGTDGVTLGTSHSFSIAGTTHTITSHDPVGVVGFLLTYKQGTSYSYKRGFFGYAVSSFSNVRFSVDGKWQNSAYRDFLTNYVGHSHYYSELLFFSSQQRQYDFNFDPFVTEGLCVYEAGPFATYDDAMAYVHSFDVFTGEITTDYDLTLGNVPSADEEIDTVYTTPIIIVLPDENGGGTIQPDEDPEDPLIGVPFYPLTVPSIPAEVETMTQEEAQTGESTYEFEIQEPEIETEVPGTSDGSFSSTWLGQWLQKILDAIRGIPTGIGDILENLFKRSSNPDTYAFDLRNYFPFCIPYDIYDFFSILAAEPEAPVINWEIPVPQLGHTFEVEVDLSPWNEVAALFRKLELLAFAVGLAFMTRDKFTRG